MQTRLTVQEVLAELELHGVSTAALTITEDPEVWTDVDTGEECQSVEISGPEDARKAAFWVLFSHYSVAPYPDRDLWSR